jgi:type II secretory pathway pseudopilin PulG
MRSGESVHQRGYAYVLLLVLVAALGVTAAGSVQLGQSMTRRHAEEALLAAGNDFRAAIASWRRSGAVSPGNPGGPRELAELVRDPRVPGVNRHLRRVPADPLTGSSEWGLVRDGGGRIVAVYSLAPGKPIKRDGFPPTQLGFANADSYAQWEFGFPPLRGTVTAPGAAASSASAPR